MKPNPIYSNAVLATRKNLKLDQSRIKRMVVAASFAESAKVLVECGYNESVINNCKENEDLIITAEHAATVETFKRLCSDEALLACVLAQYDYHNTKVLFIARQMKTVASDAVYSFGDLSLAKLKNCIADKKYGSLPKGMEKALVKLGSLPNPSAAEITAAFESALFDEIKMHIPKIKTAEGKKYFTELTSGLRVMAEPTHTDAIFSLDNVWNWFIMKQAEFRIVKTILMGKKLGMSREKIRDLLRGLNDK